MMTDYYVTVSNVAISSFKLTDIKDVDASNPTDGDVLTWDSATNRWIAEVTGITGFVPYTGATSNVDLGSHTITVDGVILNTSYSETGSESVGQFFWNTNEETANLKLNSDVTLQLGQETTVLCKNQTGSTITNGTPVMFAGSVGASGRILIMPAIADGTYLAGYTIGVATQDIANGSDGYVTWFGKVRGIDTTGTPYGESWSDGDILYVSPTTAGYLTKTKPSAPNQIISVAAVVYAHATVGTLIVRPSWHQSVQDLTDVNGTALTTTGQILVWNQSNSYFDFNYNITDYALVSSLTSHTGDSTIHYTQSSISITASQVSDFDAEVSNNSDVVANTAKVGVTTQISNLSEDTTPQLGGELDCNNNDIVLGDNQKVYFDDSKTSYFSYSSSTNKLELYVNGEKMSEWG